MNKDSGFSGLEAAIVLIAFVVVAAVFSYVMLGAGFFATQKSQEVTYSGIKQSTSNVVLDGMLYGNANPITTLSFHITIPEGGQAQKVGDIEFVMTSTDNMIATTITPVFKNRYDTTKSSAYVMSPTEKILVELALGATTQNTIGAGDKFTVEVKPKIGAASLITKTLGSGYQRGVIV